MDIQEIEILKRCITIIDQTIRSEEVFGCDEEDAWVTLKDFAREALEKQIKPDCLSAEWFGGKCCGYGYGENDDEPIEACKNCEKQSSYGID